MTNPPYISKNDVHLNNLELGYEPLNALVSSNDGFADIFKIIDTSPRFLSSEGILIVEHGYTQGNRVKNYFQQKSFNNIEQHRDINQKIRVTSASKIKI